jgi:hypothetical protein
MAFTILAVSVMVLLAGGFLVSIVFAFSYDHTLMAIGNTAATIGLLYPIVVLVAALGYALRNGSQAGKE